MVIVVAQYSARPDARFDMDYYLNNHFPAVEAAAGEALLGWEVIASDVGLDGSAPGTLVTATLRFRDAESLNAVLAAHGAVAPQARAHGRSLDSALARGGAGARHPGR